MTIPWLEILGYAASVITAVSLMMASHVRLRLLNLVGSSVFAAYGFLIHAYPVGALNVFIAVVDLYFLLRIARVRTVFTLLPMPARDTYFERFLAFHEADIGRFFPGFSATETAKAANPAEGAMVLYLLRNMVTAGVFVAHRDATDPATLHVDLDYVTKEFRDYRTGRFLFEEQAVFFREQGVARIAAEARTDSHATYLKSIGFESNGPDESGSQSFSLTLKEHRPPSQG
jgi:hypothetical protein